MTTAVSPPPPHAAWLAATRPATLTVGAVPVVVGTAIAAAEGGARPAAAGLALGVALAIQIGTNLFNDYADARRGADGDDRLGPPRATQQGWLSPGAVLAASVLAFAAAAGLATPLVAMHGAPLLAVGLACIAAGFAYTGGPWPLAYVGLGDAFVLLFFGGVATVGTAYVQTGRLSPHASLAALPIGLLATAVLVVNNLRDRASDARAGKRTLAVRLGGGFARGEYVACLTLAYLTPAAAWAAGWVGLGWLLPLLTAPLAWARARAVVRQDGAALNPELGATARLQLAFALLLAAGVLA